MRVVNTVSSLAPHAGGPSQSVAELAIACAERGHNVTICTASPQHASWTHRLSVANVETSVWPTVELTSKRTEVNLIVHDHCIWLPFNHRVASLCTKHNIRRVVSPRGMLEPWALNHRKWKKRIAWQLYQRHDLQSASAIHATAASEAEHIAKLGLETPIFVIPNGVRPPTINYLDYKPQIADPDANLRKAIFLSRVHPKKGLPMLAEAWRRVKPHGWKMVIVGPDQEGHRAHVENLTKQFGISSEWEFCGEAFGDHKWRHLAEAEIMILPTHSENFGNVVAESLLVETPVLTTKGAPWKGLELNGCGWWTEPTIEGIAGALKIACSLPSAHLREQGVRGRKWALRDFAWTSLAQQMEAVYEWILYGGTKPACVI